MLEATSPAAKHDIRYSEVGLLQRYGQQKVDHLQARLVFAGAWCLFVAFMASPAIAAICFSLVVLGDLTETTFVRRLTNADASDIDPVRAKIICFGVGVIDTVLFAVAASVPTYFCDLSGMGHDGHWEPIFTIYLLMGTGLAYIMFLPLNPLAVGFRTVVYFLATLGILIVGGGAADTTARVHELDIAGAVTFILIAIWIAKQVVARHEHRRLTELKQVTQQAELQSAYARMYEQQLDARRLALVAETANDSVMLIDRDFRISWVNESFTRITGYAAEEAIGKRPADLLNSDKTDMSTVADMDSRLAKGEAVRTVLLNRRKDGEDIWLDISQVPMLNVKGQMESLIAVERDITAAKEHERELENARKAAEEGARSKSEFLATMSHEIRTPLNGVIGMTQLLQQTELNDEQRTYADTIHGSARALLALINDVLELSKMDAQDVTLCPEIFSIRRCFGAAIHLLTPLAQEKGIDLQLDIAADAPEVLFGDDRRVTQILMNVVGNAIKFTDKGSVRVVVTVEWSGCIPHLCFSVTDTGIGIQPDMQDRIFERFSQADAAISRRFGGTGLGLTISQRLARAMGGDITVTSTFGKGACFATRLVLEAAEEESTRGAQPISEAGYLTGARILIADDNQVNRLLVQRFLKDSGAELSFALDGQQAVEHVKALAPQIVLMDVSMPNMNGLEATRAIRRMPIEQPYIVALTANAFDDDRAACLDAGMDAFLSKPVGRQQLLQHLIGAFGVGSGHPADVSLCAISEAPLRKEQKVR